MDKLVNSNAIADLLYNKSRQVLVEHLDTFVSKFRIEDTESKEGFGKVAPRFSQMISSDFTK